MRQKAQQFLTDALGLKLPYHSMGKIDSLDLFGPTELMILQLYKENSPRWKSALDIGANIGLHSILMAKQGWYVEAYEPDPETFKILVANLEANRNIISNRVAYYEQAVHSTYGGQMDFVRVHNNLTGSHLAGFKDSYGPRTTIKVSTVNCTTLWPRFDFAKIDSEGNEAELSLTMTAEHMQRLSCVMEVRNEQNAEVIYNHFKSINVPIWPQKIEWEKATSLQDMPKMNREGSIFVGHKSPWPTSSVPPSL